MSRNAPFLALVALSGCAPEPPAVPTEALLRRHYEAAIRASAIRSPVPEVMLRAIPPEQHTVRAANFTEFPAPEGRLGNRYTWFSLPARLREMCRDKPDPVLAIQQILGLAPARDLSGSGNAWKVVLFDVPRAQVFRPCPGGTDASAPRCTLDDPPPTLGEEDARFLLQQVWKSWRIGFEKPDGTGRMLPVYGSPFTGMG